MLGHSTLTGSDLLRALCHALQLAPAMRRSDNVVQIQKALCENPSQWPLLVLEEAQNLSVSALEQVRLLSHPQRLAQPFFSLLLVGDENLLPKLSLGIHRPLLCRLGFRLELKALSLKQADSYLMARLKEAAIHQNPFEESAQQLLLLCLKQIKTHADRDKLAVYFPAYLLKSLQQYLFHHGDSLYEELKHVRNALEPLMQKFPQSNPSKTPTAWSPLWLTSTAFSTPRNNARKLPPPNSSPSPSKSPHPFPSSSP